MQLGEIKGGTNVGGLLGLGNRQVAYNYYYQTANVQITNCYGVGKVTASGEVGGLIGQFASTNYGSTTVTNSYWTPETTMQEASKGGIRKSVQAMLYSSGYVSWDMANIWTIEEGNTLAYLKNVSKPNQVKKENIIYEAFEIVGGGTLADPYIITNAAQLQKVNENLEAYYKLGSDVDLTGRNWKPIGNETYPFKGQLDGNGYAIKNLNITGTSNNARIIWI